MKLTVAVVVALAAVACAIEEPIAILRSEFQQRPDGPYDFSFETENGINRQETGELQEVLDEDNKPHQVVVVRSTYSYTGEDGKPVVVNYSAGPNGYEANGDSIPKLPSRR